MKSVTCTWRASCDRPVACQRTLCEPSEKIDDHYDLDFDDNDDDNLIDVMDDPAQVGLEVGGGERLKVGQGGGGDVPVDDQDHDGDDWDRQQGEELPTEFD